MEIQDNEKVNEKTSGKGKRRDDDKRKEEEGGGSSSFYVDALESQGISSDDSDRNPLDSDNDDDHIIKSLRNKYKGGGDA